MSNMYAGAIADALSKKDVTLDELKVLEHHAEAILQTQGDLAGALKKLKERIKEIEDQKK